MHTFFYNIFLATVGTVSAGIATFCALVLIVYVCSQFFKMGKNTVRDYFPIMMITASSIVWFFYILLDLSL